MNLNKRHIVQIFCGPERDWLLPGDILFIILEIANLAAVGKRHLRFVVYYPRSFVTADGLRLRRSYQKKIKNRARNKHGT